MSSPRVRQPNLRLYLPPTEESDKLINQCVEQANSVLGDAFTPSKESGVTIVQAFPNTSGMRFRNYKEVAVSFLSKQGGKEWSSPMEPSLGYLGRSVGRVSLALILKPSPRLGKLDRFSTNLCQFAGQNTIKPHEYHVSIGSVDAISLNRSGIDGIQKIESKIPSDLSFDVVKAQGSSDLQEIIDEMNAASEKRVRLAQPSTAAHKLAETPAETQVNLYIPGTIPHGLFATLQS